MSTFIFGHRLCITMIMKINILLLAATVICFSACNTADGTETISEKNNKVPKKEIEKKVTVRDVSITPERAFNDIFLDSMAMEDFIKTSALSDSITRRMRSFYNARNYQYAWFSSKGLIEQTRGFWNLQSYENEKHNDLSDHYKALRKEMDELELKEKLVVKTSDKRILNTEFLLTENFIKYILNNYEDGIVKRKEMERFIPLTKRDVLKLSDSIINKKHNDEKYYEDGNVAYRLLKTKLKQYDAVARQGGWPQIPITKAGFKLNDSSSAVIALKSRLSLAGLMQVDSTPTFNDAAVQGVKLFQTSLGLTPTGIVNAALIKELNIPVTERIKQILINMDRMRWMPEADGDLFLVNIPEFKLKAFEKNKEVFNMRVVVGKEGHNTMMFKGDMNQVVFSPYWNLTPDIVRDEIVPAMNRNPNYLAQHNMEIVSQGGGLPVIRQLPGEGNSLGKVKFLFPNSFNIYFHDTPAKSLFANDKRAYSHGCIRLSEPQKLAEYVLRNQPEWTTDRIVEKMNEGKETFVKLEKRIPVIISYYTAWVDERGVLNFRDDIYGYDKTLKTKMFTGI